MKGVLGVLGVVLDSPETNTVGLVLRKQELWRLSVLGGAKVEVVLTQRLMLAFHVILR